MKLQEAIDAPVCHSTHFPIKILPYEHPLGMVLIEKWIGETVIEELRSRGRIGGIIGSWEIGRRCAVARDSEAGALKAATNARDMQRYAGG